MNNRALPSIPGSCERDYGDSILHDIWIEDSESRNYLEAGEGINGLEQFLDLIQGPNTEVIRINLTSLDKAHLEISRKVLKLAEKGKRIYILAGRKNESDSNMVKSLAGNTLIRFTERKIPDFIVNQDRSALIRMEGNFNIGLYGPQVIDLAKWFNWFFFREAYLEILDDLNLEGESCSDPPFDPVYPGISEFIRFLDRPDSLNVDDVENQSILLSSTELARVIKKVNTTIITVNGIDKFDSNLPSSQIINGYRSETALPSFLFRKGECLIVSENQEGYIEIKCSDPAQIDGLKNKYERSGPYHYDRERILNSLTDGTSINVNKDWLLVKDSAEIEIIKPFTAPILKPIGELRSQVLDMPKVPIGIKHVTFKYSINPPSLPKGASEHPLVEEWTDYLEKMKTVLDEQVKLSRTLIDNGENVGGVLDKLKELSAYSWNEPTPDHERKRKDLQSIVDDLEYQFIRMKARQEEEERQKDEEGQKALFEKKREERKKEIQKTVQEIAQVEIERDSKKGDVGNQKFGQKIAELRQYKSILEKGNEIQFKYEPRSKLIIGKDKKNKKTEAGHFKQARAELPQYPKKGLPRAGQLFRIGTQNYLAISSWDAVPQAIEEAKEFDAIPVSY